MRGDFKAYFTEHYSEVKAFNMSPLMRVMVE